MRQFLRAVPLVAVTALVLAGFAAAANPDTLVNVENIVFWTYTTHGRGGATGSPNRFQITSVDATIAPIPDNSVGRRPNRSTPAITS